MFCNSKVISFRTNQCVQYPTKVIAMAAVLLTVLHLHLQPTAAMQEEARSESTPSSSSGTVVPRSSADPVEYQWFEIICGKDRHINAVDIECTQS